MEIDIKYYLNNYKDKELSIDIKGRNKLLFCKFIDVIDNKFIIVKEDDTSFYPHIILNLNEIISMGLMKEEESKDGN